ncbi:MAG: 50S ribosomal protein L11 methyltransferase [Bacteroidia bacterium]|nr:50S ribosomal protein L11 methyltransferase [Bacteroidia bacterium]MDW8089423.1 hypothetical protein [Bacteroidia bacterium]
MRVIAVGCAEAGVLAAFLLTGASEAVGTDIKQLRLESGQTVALTLQFSLRLVPQDILRQEIPSG